MKKEEKLYFNKETKFMNSMVNVKKYNRRNSELNTILSTSSGKEEYFGSNLVVMWCMWQEISNTRRKIIWRYQSADFDRCPIKITICYFYSPHYYRRKKNDSCQKQLIRLRNAIISEKNHKFPPVRNLSKRPPVGVNWGCTSVFRGC